ncbi:MAG: SGNH/GDSL hydrolase family protein, partial [Candidatus Binataceae bacterium]
MSSKRRVAANLALILAGVALAFIVAEVAVRVSSLAKTNLYTWDAYRGWGLKPGASGWQREEGAGFVSVNRAGFRGPQWTIAKPPGTLRIAVVGDSFTEA